jgi:hypothetical protein
MRSSLARYLAGKKSVQRLMSQPADLSAFRERPTPRLILGLAIMALSFLMGWPAVAALSVVAVWMNQPLIFIIGGPLTYGLSYIVFLIGAWLSRTPHYLGILGRYLAYRILRKILA